MHPSRLLPTPHGAQNNMECKLAYVLSHALVRTIVHAYETEERIATEERIRIEAADV